MKKSHNTSLIASFKSIKNINRKERFGALSFFPKPVGMYLMGDVMKCYQCKKVFHPRRTFETLWEQPLQLRCDRCDRRYIRYFRYEVLPIQGFLIHHYALFHGDEPIQEAAFLDESLKVLLIFLKQRQPNDLFLWLECLESPVYDCLDALHLCDIFIISLYPPKLMV